MYIAGRIQLLQQKLLQDKEFNKCLEFFSYLKVLFNTAMYYTKLSSFSKGDTFSNPVNIHKFHSWLHIVVYQLYQTNCEHRSDEPVGQCKLLLFSQFCSLLLSLLLFGVEHLNEYS